MSTISRHIWTALAPPLRSAHSKKMYLQLVKALIRAIKEVKVEAKVLRFEQARLSFMQAVEASRYQDSAALLAAGLVISDLAIQGWSLRIKADTPEVHPPLQSTTGHAQEKDRVRQQELVKRNSQLKQPSVVRFIKFMEQVRLHEGRFVSIFSLMRDGRELSNSLETVRSIADAERQEALKKAIDPYLQFIPSGSATCSYTGLRLMDIWRYFRHTWSNQYMSVPGRSMQFLVRDRAAHNHPVVGICALSSPIMQIRERDNWVGWNPDVFLARVSTNPSAKLAKWLKSSLDESIRHIYVEDLIEDAIVSARDIAYPNESVIARLEKEGEKRRRMHHRFVQRSDHKSRKSQHDVDGAIHWRERAKTHLFRSKRALTLATLLRAQLATRPILGRKPSRESLQKLAATKEGQDAIRIVLRKAKADRVGISVADISVCGAVQPYNAILGGKLVAMLATSPEVVSEYRKRYRNAESEIASAMAGRAVVRTPHLVLLGTTSLYGVGSSQYNRIKIPCERLNGDPGSQIKYEELGHSEAFGTSQYSEETVAALTSYVQQVEGGVRVNSIFGEGISPKLRKVRQGLDLLKFPASLLLQHHRHRIVYGIPLISNLSDYLIGADSAPHYLYALRGGEASTSRIAAWWRERWLRNRIESDEVLAEVRRHALVQPVRHGARVTIPGIVDQQPLFLDL